MKDRCGDVLHAAICVERNFRQGPHKVVTIFCYRLLALRPASFEIPDAVVLGVVADEPNLKFVRSYCSLILPGVVGVIHDTASNSSHRERTNPGTGFVQGCQRLASSHCGKADRRPSRLDTRLRSAGASGTLASGGQSEKQQYLSLGRLARETNCYGPDGAKWLRRIAE